MNVRSLDIRRGEAWTDGRLPLHMALATAPDRTLRRPKRRFRLWHWIACAYLIPSGAALATVTALWILRQGL